jgi:hypothetical protein
MIGARILGDRGFHKDASMSEARDTSGHPQYLGVSRTFRDGAR